MLSATSNGTIAVYIWDNDSPLTFTNSTVTATSANSYALYAPVGGIEVSGGSLTLNAPKSYATYTAGDLVAKDGVQLTLTNVAHGLAAAGTVELSGATGTVTAGNAALYSNDKGVVIEGCSNLTLSGKMTVNAQRGSISIGDSDLNVSGTDAIYAKQDISITDSRIEVTATENPINTGSGFLTISGEHTMVDATGGLYMGAGSELIISGGTVIVDITSEPSQSFMAALYGNKAIRISGGTVHASVSHPNNDVKTYAVRANGVAEFAGGTITLEGGTGAIYVSKNGGSVSFGGNSKWYQWATSPTGAVTQATDDPYSYADDKSAYLRFEPVGTTYGLTVENGEGSGSFAAGTQVSISADAYDAEGHFTGWTVTDDSTGAGVLADATSASTTFTMPAGNVTLAATYEDHSLAHHEAVAPTCTDDGTLEYWECDGCGALFSDGAGTTLTAEEDLVDPATGHHYENGVCTGCGERQPGQVTPPSNPTYPPETGETENGEVTVTPSRPRKGDEVTIAPEPDEGFEVGSVGVTGKNGEPVEVTDNGDGTWTFVQPSGKVTITVTFVCDGGDLCPTHRFADVDQDAWYHGAVDWAVTGGVINGYGDGSGLLGPLNPITRAEVAQVLWNLAGRPGAEADLSALPDVDPSGWYAGAVAWCLSEGVFEGYGDIFGTGRAITREELATVLWRLSGAPEPAAGLSSFSDAGSVSDYATCALSWAVESGVVTGKDDGTRLDPQGTCTRAEAAAMLMRLFAE